MNEIVDIADLDTIFLTYNEPQKEEYWVKIQNMVPWAIRVDGVLGSDAAHKAAADASETDRFILIDGDNMPDPEFFNQQLTLTSHNENKVFRWKARNHINGLMYGNGGLSCWTKEFIYNMKTHEASDGSDETAVEFCFDPNYWAMHDCYSTTYPNQSAEQAWRAGFREGVKMCLNKGSKPTLEEFESNVVSRNYDNLCIWMSIGADVDHGTHAQNGALLGTYCTMLGDVATNILPDGTFGFAGFDYRMVQDFTELDRLYKIYKEVTLKRCVSHHSLRDTLQKQLCRRLDLNIASFSQDTSRFFKSHYNSQFHNKGIMVTEMDVIRGIEGW